MELEGGVERRGLSGAGERGREGAAALEAVGAAVKDFKPGDRVMSSAAGGFAEYVVVPASIVWVNPPDLPHDIAAMLEPCGIAVHASLAGSGVAGQSVAAAMRQTAPRARKRPKIWQPKRPRGANARNAAPAPKRRRRERHRGGITPRAGTAMRSRANLPCGKPPCVISRHAIVTPRVRTAIIAAGIGAMIWARPCRDLAIWCRPSC